MAKRCASVVIAFIMAVVFSASTYGEEKTAEEKKPAVSVEEIKNALGMSIYLQGGYTYNFENPDNQENGLRVFDHKANSFTLDLAQIVFTREAPMNGLGYKLKLSAGETAKFIHSNGLGKADDPFDLTEAYVEYLAPVGKGLKFTFGKWVTYHGAEVIEAKDNPNYSRSFLFNYAIPFTHTGLKVAYTFSDAVNASVYLVNGWDNTNDNNKAKTVGASVGYTPIEQFSTTFNVMYGPEKDNNNSDNRFLFDWVGTIKPVKNLSFILNFDYASEQHSAADGGTAVWWGGAGIAKYDFSDLFSVALRYEYFDDRDGVRTGTAQKLQEVTLTPQFAIAKNLLLRPEYRHDWSSEQSFPDANGKSRKKNQDTLALGVMYTW